MHGHLNVNFFPFQFFLLFFYFTSGRYIECLSLTYTTDKSKA